MKPSGTLKHFAAAFFIALVVYVIFYNGIEHRRTRNGPWQVAFTNETTIPTLVINQPKLNISNLKISFPEDADKLPRMLSGELQIRIMRFDQPQPVPFDVPFGQCLFEDTTFQPGTIVFKLFGHEIQLLPRALTIDKTEYPWQSNTNIALRRGF